MTPKAGGGGGGGPQMHGGGPRMQGGNQEGMTHSVGYQGQHEVDMMERHFMNSINSMFGMFGNPYHNPMYQG